MIAADTTTCVVCWLVHELEFAVDEHDQHGPVQLVVQLANLLEGGDDVA